MKTIIFNTGRKYSILGQRIAAAELDSGHIVFADIDRGLEYVIQPGQALLTESSVMSAYDRDGLDSVYILKMDMSEILQLVKQLTSAAAKAPVLDFIR